MKKMSIALALIATASIAQARYFIGIEGGYTAGAMDSKNRSGLNATNSSYLLIPGGSTISNSFKDRTEASLKLGPWSGYSLALNFGNEYLYANNYIGTRIGAKVGYTEISQKQERRDNGLTTYIEEFRGYIDAGLSVDMVFNFYASERNSFGIFGGVGMDYHYLIVNEEETSKSNEWKGGSVSNVIGNTPSRHSLDFNARVGFSTLIAKHHRIDLIAKLPIGYVAAGSDSKVKINGSEPLRTSFSVGYNYIF